MNKTRTIVAVALLPAFPGCDSVNSFLDPKALWTGVAIAAVLATLRKTRAPFLAVARVVWTKVISASKTFCRSVRHVTTAGKVRRDARFAKRVKQTAECKAIFAAIEIHGSALLVLHDLAERGMLMQEMDNSIYALNVCKLLHFTAMRDDQSLPGKYMKAHPDGPAVLGTALIHETPIESRHPLLRDFIDEMCHRYSLLFSRQLKNGKYLVINIKHVDSRRFEYEEGKFHVWESNDGLSPCRSSYDSHMVLPAPLDINDAYNAARILWTRHGGWKDEDKNNEDPVPPYRDFLAKLLSDLPG